MIAKLLPYLPPYQFSERLFRQMQDIGLFGPDEHVRLAEGEVVLFPANGGPDDTERRLFSVDEYERMIDAGILTDEDHVELIRGEVVYLMAIGDPHMACVKRLNHFLGGAAAGKAISSVQDAIRLADSDPQPDFALAVPRADYYRSGKPRPADLYLVVEVADTSFDKDRDVKGPLYAENAIPEYWIFNLTDDTVHVFRGPQADGTWASSEQFTRGATLTIATLPGVSVAVNDILP